MRVLGFALLFVGFLWIVLDCSSGADDFITSFPTGETISRKAATGALKKQRMESRQRHRRLIIPAALMFAGGPVLGFCRRKGRGPDRIADDVANHTAPADAPEQNRPPKPESRIWRFLGRIGLPVTILVALILGGVALAFLIGMNREERRVRAEVQQALAAIRAAGEPTTFADLARLFPDPPPASDAGKILQHAMSLAKYPLNIDELSIPYLGAPIPKSTAHFSERVLADCRVMVLTNRPAMDALPAAWPADCWLPNNFPNFTSVDPMIISKVQTLMESLAVDCVIQIESSNTDEAVKDIIQCFQISRTPRYIRMRYLLGQVGERLCCESLERLLTQRKLTAPQIDRLCETLVRSLPNRMRNILWGHHCIGITGFEMVRTALNQPPNKLDLLTGGLRRLLEKRRYSDADYLRWLQLRKAYLDAVDLVGVERVRRMTELDQLVRALPRSFLQIVGLPEWGREAKVELETDAYVISVRMALAVERYRLEHSGNLPETLDALVPTILPAVPVDPFTGKQLKYLRRSPGYVIYSLGADGVDNQGKEKESGETDSAQYDVTCTIER